MGYGHAKTELYETIEEYFQSMRKKREELEKNLDYVESVLISGAEKASILAQDVLDRARKAVGI